MNKSGDYVAQSKGKRLKTKTPIACNFDKNHGVVGISAVLNKTDL